MTEKETMYQLIMKIWNVPKNNSDKEKNDEYWQKVIDEVNETVLSVPDEDEREFVKKSLLAYMDLIVKKWRKAKNE